MLSKKYRLSTERYNTVWKHCVVLRSPHLLVRVLKNTQSFFCAVTAGKKIVSTAVQRNTLRRKVYACVEMILREYPHITGEYVIVVTQQPLPRSTTLCDEIRGLLLH